MNVLFDFFIETIVDEKAMLLKDVSLSECRCKTTDWFWKNCGMKTRGTTAFLYHHPAVKTVLETAAASAVKDSAKTRYSISKKITKDLQMTRIVVMNCNSSNV